jgi:arylsulfatase A-like enzyme
VNQRGLGELPKYQAVGTERAPEAYRIRYDAEIRYFDREFGRLLAHFSEHGLLENTLIILTADHGESLGERNFWFSHGQHLFDELVRVPFIVRYPAGYGGPPAVDEGTYRRVDPLVSHLDVMPTILDAFGLQGPAVYGHSLLAGELSGERMVAHRGAGWEGVTDNDYRTFSSRAGTHLYHVRQDPLETRNLAAQEGARVAGMKERFQALQAALPTVQLKGVAVDRDAAELSALKALGYAGDEDADEQDG